MFLAPREHMYKLMRTTWRQAENICSDMFTHVPGTKWTNVYNDENYVLKAWTCKNVLPYHTQSTQKFTLMKVKQRWKLMLLEDVLLIWRFKELIKPHKYTSMSTNGRLPVIKLTVVLRDWSHPVKEVKTHLTMSSFSCAPLIKPDWL